MRTPSKNKQWNRLSAHGAPESKVIMPRIVYRLALDCFSYLESFISWWSESTRGNFIPFAVQMHGCSLGSWTPLDNDKVTKKVDVSVRTWVRNLGRRCSVSLSWVFHRSFHHIQSFSPDFIEGCSQEKCQKVTTSLWLLFFPNHPSLSGLTVFLKSCQF